MEKYPARNASETIAAISAGQLTCRDWVGECVESWSRYEDQVKAFCTWAGPQALASAERLDGAGPRGLLCGMPLAVKDIFDTWDLPTEFNSPLYEGRQPNEDAACVALLREQGAVLMGKATTVEFASLGQTAPTTNPYDASRTPGGSSSGSAAAVAAGMAAVALGTQTGGSTIRPASFCGVAAIKPTFGVVPVTGMRPYAPSLDTVGWMARCVADLKLVARAYRLKTEQRLSSPLRLGFYETPYWRSAQRPTRDALTWATQLLSAAGIMVEPVEAIADSERLNEAQNLIMHGEGKAAFQYEYLRWRERLHPAFIDEVENRMGITASQLRWAYDYLGAMRPAFDRAFAGFDAWLTPAVPGVAPRGLESTGDAVFNRLWTGLHMPAVTLPGYRDKSGLPVGVQLVGPRFEDWRLLQVAEQVEAALKA